MSKVPSNVSEAISDRVTVWQARFYSDDQGILLSWHSSRDRAWQHLREQQRERGEEAQGPEGVDVMHIPTDPEELVGWLNTHFTSDNG